VTATILDPSLSYYAAHGCALFPIPAGSKNPTGIVESFKRDYSTSPAQWEAWRAAHPGCNFGIVAFASRLIIVDVDTSGDRNEAWALWCELCTAWGIPVAMPQVQSARGGWHIYFKVPADIDPSTLRQPDAVKGRINIRCIGYTVAAGSYYDGTAKGEESGPYSLLSDAAPYPAPAALIEHCARKEMPAAAPTATDNNWQREEVLSILRHLRSIDDPLVSDGGGERWASCLAARNTGVITKAEAETLFQYDTHPPGSASFDYLWSREETGDLKRSMASLKDAAVKSGWKGMAASEMFSNIPATVAQIAAAAGATLASGVTPIPMMGGEEELTRFCEPIIAEFMSETDGAPFHPEKSDYPELPQAANGRGLYASMQAALVRLFVMCEQKPKFDINRANNLLGVLQQFHADTFQAVLRRLETMGHKPSRRKIGHVSQNIEEQVQRGTTGFDKWIRDDKTQKIESDNPDNIRFGLEYLGVELRWNAWLERMQVNGGTEKECRWSEWTNVDDSVVVRLLTRWRRTRSRFCPGKDFTWETLLAVAQENTQDPVLEVLADLQSKWDGVPRLSGWLTRYCGTPSDAYHQAVSKLIIGGMVMRARKPGCKFDFMPIFFGKQGTGKSTLAAMLSLRLDWFSDTIMLGDASKELVLALAGKLVVEISEMGMRGNANVNHVKAMISRQIDSGRTAYARAVAERKRRNIFIGTTNEDTPLSDPTGNRRFLPVRVNSAIDLAAFFVDIGQLVGEAAVLESRGEKFDLPKDVWESAAVYQESARAASDLEIQFCDWFAPTEYSQTAFVATPDLVKLNAAAGRRNVGNQVHPIMERLGFRHTQCYLDGKKTGVWVRGPEMLPKNIPTVPRFIVDVTQPGAPRVVLRGGAAAPGGPMPPAPSGR